MILNTIYDNEFNLKYDSNTEKVFGPVLFRESESLTDYHYYKDLLLMYSNLDIRKVFGLSLNEYLNQTPYARDIMNDTAIEIHEKLKAELDETEKELQNIKEGLPYEEQITR